MKKILLPVAVVCGLFIAAPAFGIEKNEHVKSEAVEKSQMLQKQEDLHPTERTEDYSMTQEEQDKADQESYHLARMSVQERREHEQKLARRHINEHMKQRADEDAADEAAKEAGTEPAKKPKNTFQQ